MNLRRLLVALCVAAILAAPLGACGPFGDDDGANGDPDAFTIPPTATREVVMSTFTPTAVVSDADKTATVQAGQSAGAGTATARAGLPTPTPAIDIDEEDILYPPRTRLETPGQLVDSYLGTYSWQFSDQTQTYGSIEAPIIVLEQGDPVELSNGDDLALSYYGNEYRRPPQQLEVAVYDFASNSAVPTSGQAQADEPAFAIRTDPVQNLRVDPLDPTFTLQGFAPGHYIIWAQGRWGQHPVLDRPIFVTWVFDIEIVE